jgi:hypothetical protein
MKSRQPLNDTWLFWNAERLEEFPHVPENDYAPATVDGDPEGGSRGSSPRAMFEALLLYVGGVSAAMVGVGLVIMIGSFISAYAALNGSDDSRYGDVSAPTHLSLQRPAPLAKSAPPEPTGFGAATTGTAPGEEGSAAGGSEYVREPSAIRGPG